MISVSKTTRFAGRVVKAMEAKGLNAADMVTRCTEAAGTKIGRHRIQMLLNGYTTPTAPEAAALATVLGMTTDNLLDDITALPEPARRRVTTTATGESREVVFARNLNNAMAERGWRPVDLLGEAQRYMPKGQELTKGNISYYCRAQNTPTLPRLMAIAKALHTTPEKLMPAVRPIFNVELDAPPLVANFTGDEAHLRINMKVPADIAMEVMRLLRPIRDQSSD